MIVLNYEDVADESKLYYDKSFENKRFGFLVILSIFILLCIFGYTLFYIYYNDVKVDIFNPDEVNVDTSVGELINAFDYFLATGYEGTDNPALNTKRDRNYNNPINATRLTKSTCNQRNMVFEKNTCKCITPFWGEFCEKQSTSIEYYQLGKYFGSIDNLISKNGNLLTINTITWCSNFSLNNYCEPDGNVEVICKQTPLCIGYYYNQGLTSLFIAPSTTQDIVSLNVEFIDSTVDLYGNYVFPGNIFIKQGFQKKFIQERVYRIYNDVEPDDYWIYNATYWSTLIEPDNFSYNSSTLKDPYVMLAENRLYSLLNGQYDRYYMVSFTDLTQRMTQANRWTEFCNKIGSGVYAVDKRITVSSTRNIKYVYFVLASDMLRYCNFN